ncbi:MAG: hypothetical protein LUE63_04550 [Lachnospiraceae bacterium]|nr:hypothetical protein [Lachnospiraceae bacterium]
MNRNRDEQSTYIFRHLAAVFHTGVFCLQGEELTSYEENAEYNPLMTGFTIFTASGSSGRRDCTITR